jgi:hypothetical protein
MLFYNGNTKAIALQLIPKPHDVNGLNSKEDSNDKLAYDAAKIENVLVIPIEGGELKIPKPCDSVKKHYMPLSSAQADEPDMVIDAAANLNCEASAEQCALATAPQTQADSCDLVTVFPTGVIQTNQGNVDCAGKTLYSVLNRPNLIFNPGTTPTSSAIEGRTGQLVATGGGSAIYASTDTVFHVGKNAPPFTLNDGGTLGMTDNSRLKMRGPAIITPANGSVTLTNGGQLLDANGAAIRDIPAGSVYTPANPILPLTFLVARSIEIPSGYQIPTQPSPYVRLPLDQPIDQPPQ